MLTAFCAAVAAGADITAAAADFGRESCGLLTERELERCLLVLLAGELQAVRADPAAVIAVARAGHRRQAEAYRVTELLVDPLSGLDSEARFVSELWEATSAGRPTWLVVLGPSAAVRSRSLLDDLELGLLRRPGSGRGSMVLLRSGVVLLLTTTRDAALEELQAFTRRWPLRSGRVIPGERAASVADLSWWLVGVVAEAVDRTSAAPAATEPATTEPAATEPGDDTDVASDV